jgi:hypothetical protein
MALKRLCRCGTIIDYKDKLCDKCTVIAKANKTERNRIYDAECRNKESTEIYHSPRWQLLTQQCKSRFKGIDIYEYYVNNNLTFGSLSHHIIEVNEDKNRVYDIDNLIYLSSPSHKTIHNICDKSAKSKQEMQQLLFSLTDRFKKEFR